MYFFITSERTITLSRSREHTSNHLLLLLCRRAVSQRVLHAGADMQKSGGHGHSEAGQASHPLPVQEHYHRRRTSLHRDFRGKRTSTAPEPQQLCPCFCLFIKDIYSQCPFVADKFCRSFYWPSKANTWVFHLTLLSDFNAFLASIVDPFYFNVVQGTLHLVWVGL